MPASVEPDYQITPNDLGVTQFCMTQFQEDQSQSMYCKLQCDSKHFKRKT